MSPEKLLDAMQYLPDEMLEQTDRLRQKKPLRWYRLAAMAACLCLVFGLAWGLSQPGKKSEDGAAPEYGLGDVLENGSDMSQTGTTGWLAATVLTVAEDRLTVQLASGKQAVVLLEKLEDADIPTFQAGEKLRLYLEDTDGRGNETLIPYKIEIEEEIQ